MARILLLRPDDHLLLGIRWSDFTVSGEGGSARLTAGAQAHILIELPPQHVGEETSPRKSDAPLKLSAGHGGEMVPIWRGFLSGPTRLKFKIAAGTQIPLSVEGVLSGILNNPLLVAEGVPGPDDTAIEIPSRLVISPRGRSTSGQVVCRHPTRPVSTISTGLWRTCLIDPVSPAHEALLDAKLTLTVVDRATADAADPEFGQNHSIPLARGDRVRLFTETSIKPAGLTRLELSALGGTLNALGKFDNFEWEHRAVLGRDMYVRKLSEGAMYPFGHRAEFLQVAERIYDDHPTAGGAAVLRFVNVLTIVEPVRHAPADGPIRRAFPLGDVEITRTVFTNLAEPTDETTSLPGVGPVRTHFWPRTLDGSKVRFPVACTTSSGLDEHRQPTVVEVNFDIPMLFVRDLRPAVESLTSPILAERLKTDYGAVEVPIPATNIDLVGAASRQRSNGDVHEVHSLTIAGVLADGYRPKLTELEVALPALRVLLGDDRRTKVAFASNYLRNGPAEDVLLVMLTQAISVDFTKGKADRSGGLVAPKYETNAISRTLGPVHQSAVRNRATRFIDPNRLFPDDAASLLGFPLRLLIRDLESPPEITATPIAGKPPEVRMHWQDVKLKSVVPFVAKPTTKLTLTVTTGPNEAETKCDVSDFALQLPPGPKPVLRLSFAAMKFTQHGGKSPRLEVEGVQAEFLGQLRLLEKLRDAVDFGDAGKLIDVRPNGISVRYSVPAPPIASGVFVMRNIVFTAGVEVPFNGGPVSILLGFASRANPFQLSVMMFGGGGYVELALNRYGLQRFEAALEFGAFVAVDFVVASGEVHALGGVRFVLERAGEDTIVTVTGYLRIGGCVEVLGLISVSIELCLLLTYRSVDNALVGRATLVIEVDLTLWSESVEIDSGEWKLAGGSDRHRALGAKEAASRADPFSLWRDYRAAFVPEDERDIAVARALQNPAPTAAAAQDTTLPQ